MKALARPILEKWQSKLGLHVTFWGVKRMKTKWGSCNPDSRRIWLNLELAKKSPRCVEYIVVHELLHLRERHHGDRFTQRMDGALPSWRSCRVELNRAPLAYEEWIYGIDRLLCGRPTTPLNPPLTKGERRGWH